jgi:hypothetical protein
MDNIDKTFKCINWIVFVACLIFVVIRGLYWLAGTGGCNEIGCENSIMFLISIAVLVAFLPFLGIALILKKLIKKLYKSS